MFGGDLILPKYRLEPVPFTVGRPKPDALPADIVAAINVASNADNEAGNLSLQGRNAQRAFVRASQARIDLEALILKHLRGEA